MFSGVPNSIESYRAIGQGTNNIGELTAIQVALELLDGLEAEGRARAGPSVHVLADSKYSIGVLAQGWKAKKNVELIRNIKVY